MRPTEALVGACTALCLPAHLSRGRLNALMSAAPAGPRRALEPEPAIRVGLALLVQLARLRLPLWKNTCLYRSTLRCLLLRRAGQPAVLRIGARRADGAPAGIAAHAWVEVRGQRLWEDEAAEAYTPLRGAGAGV